MSTTLTDYASLRTEPAAARWMVRLLEQIYAQAAADVTDRHEISVFVLDRVELATGAERVG